MKQVTVCSLDCPDACSIIASKNEAGVLTIEGNPAHPITRGFVCAKIKTYPRRLKREDRITRPLIRKGSIWYSVPWEEALGICVEKIEECRREPSSILHLHGDGSMGILTLAGRLLFETLGASRISGSLCDTAGIEACIRDFGSLDHNDVRDLTNARAIVNWGKDLSRSSVHCAALVREARKKGAKVLTVSPGGDGNVPFSDRMVGIRPGTDRFLAVAVARLFVERGVIDRQIEACTRGWPEFRESILRVPLEELCRKCDVSPSDVESIFECYRKEEPTATLVGWGLQRYRFGGENLRFINALALISGNVGRSGGGSYFNISSRRNFNTTWAAVPGSENLRTFPKPLIAKSILDADTPPVKMLWVNGFNPVTQAPDSHGMRKAFEKVEFKVVVDAFMTDTARCADVVLPCRLAFEQEDLVGSFLHDYVHYARPVAEAPEGTRDDFWIFSEVGKRLDPPIRIPAREECLRMSLDSKWLDTGLDELKERGFVKASRSPIAYAGMKFDHSDERYHFPRDLHDDPPPSRDFPLRLLTLLRREAIHSQIPPEDQRGKPKIWVGPGNSCLEKIDRTEEVFLVSPLGRMAVSLAVLPGLHPEAVVYRRGDWVQCGGGVNQLIAAALTDMGDAASYYSQSVRLEN